MTVDVPCLSQQLAADIPIAQFILSRRQRELETMQAGMLAMQEAYSQSSAKFIEEQVVATRLTSQIEQLQLGIADIVSLCAVSFECSE